MFKKILFTIFIGFCYSAQSQEIQLIEPFNLTDERFMSVSEVTSLSDEPNVQIKQASVNEKSVEFPVFISQLFISFNGTDYLVVSDFSELIDFEYSPETRVLFIAFRDTNEETFEAVLYLHQPYVDFLTDKETSSSIGLFLIK